MTTPFRRISVMTRTEDPELLRIAGTLDDVFVVGGRDELEQCLCALLERSAEGRAVEGTATLDLIGHSTAEGLLQLGSWVIDGAHRVVRAFFRELDEQDVFRRLGITAIRLLGCSTASSQAGKTTLRRLAQIANVEVCGTGAMIHAAHYGRDGFRADMEHLLVNASEAVTVRATDPAAAVRRVLDVDVLPARPLGAHARAWPRAIATREQGQAVLRLIRRADGARMPGLLAQPSCEIALPAARAGTYHLLQVVMNGEFVRVYFEDSAEGVVFPVSDPASLRSWIAQLSAG